MLLGLHHRLQAGDRTASAEVAEALYLWLQKRLQAAIPYASPDDIADVAADTLIRYIAAPGKFQPERGKSLAGYLLMDGRRDLLNVLEKQRRRPPAVELSEAVADRLADRNVGSMGSEARVAYLPQELEGIVAAALPAKMDRRILELMMDRVRETSSYVAVMGIGASSTAEQAREVKRAKDRIRARLRRAGVRP